MIAWTIEAAISCKFIDKTVVTTDSAEIAKVAKTYGAEIPFMRSDYADDHSPISLVTVDMLKRLETNFDIVIQMMPNCPLRRSVEVEDAFNFFVSDNHSFQISCFEYGWMNPWWSHTQDEDFTAKPFLQDFTINKRSQDLPKLYCPTGAIWIAETEALLQSETFYGKAYRFHPMNWMRAVDIDDEKDLDLASIIFQFIGDA
jgi:N-acylneuraminate cytidylyltransferase